MELMEQTSIPPAIQPGTPREPLDAESLDRLIRHECQPFLSQCGGLKMYRGLDTACDSDGFHARIRENREPRSSSQNVPFNIAFNLMLEQRFGYPLVRYRSLFCCGDIKEAIRYARKRTPDHVCEIYPRGEFRFVYATNVRDSVAYDDRIGERYAACFRGPYLKRCTPLLEEMNLTLEGLRRFFADNPDLTERRHYPCNTTLHEHVLGVLGRMLESKYGTPYAYRNDDLPSALAAGVEIMILDCPGGYYARKVESLPPPPDKALARKAAYRFWSDLLG